MHQYHCQHITKKNIHFKIKIIAKPEIAKIQLRTTGQKYIGFCQTLYPTYL